MLKESRIFMIFRKLKVNKLLIRNYLGHDLYAIFAKHFDIFEVIGIDSESLLFAKLEEYKTGVPHLISRRQYNDRGKFTASFCNTLRERITEEHDGSEDYFCVNSKPIEIYRISRVKCCSMGRKALKRISLFGYGASRGIYYYGYKLYALCGLSGVIHSFDLAKANMHDIHYLKDVKVDYHNCTVIGDRGYISTAVQLFFETANNGWKCYIGQIKRNGSQYLLHLLKQE